MRATHSAMTRPGYPAERATVPCVFCRHASIHTQAAPVSECQLCESRPIHSQLPHATRASTTHAMQVVAIHEGSMQVPGEPGAGAARWVQGRLWVLGTGALGFLVEEELLCMRRIDAEVAAVLAGGR